MGTRIALSLVPFDYLLPACTLSIAYVQFGGAGTNDSSCRRNTPCSKFIYAILVFVTINYTNPSGNISIMGTSFAGENVVADANCNYIFTMDEQTSRPNLTYSGKAGLPFFSVTTGEVTFTNLTIVFSSANGGPFVSLTSSLLFYFFFYRMHCLKLSS
jgi:hypothetical protein